MNRQEQYEKISQDLKKIGISCEFIPEAEKTSAKIILHDFQGIYAFFYHDKQDFLSIAFLKYPRYTNYQDSYSFEEKNKKPNRVKIDKLNYNSVMKLVEYAIKAKNHLEGLSAIRKSAIKALLLEAKEQGTRNSYNKYNDHYYLRLENKYLSYEASIEKRSGFIQEKITFRSPKGMTHLEAMKKIGELQ